MYGVVGCFCILLRWSYSNYGLYEKNNFMSVILVSDVFGVTPALLELAEQLDTASIIDPYKGQMMDFQSEKDAYSYFVGNVGLDNYLSILLGKLKLIAPPITLIGFSVGASVIWRLSEINDHNTINQAFCYYGSQIRNFIKIEPKFRLHIVFPLKEPHFDVEELESIVSRKSNVTTSKVKFLHGFMNYYSINFSDIGYAEHLDKLSVNFTSK